MESRLERLSINPVTQGKEKVTHLKKSKEVVADSWDDEASSDSEAQIDIVTPSTKSPVPNAPPPTPISPTSGLPSWDTLDQSSFSSRPSDRDGEDLRRPDKSIAVASRLIAAGLGVRAPKKTEEQKAYEKAIQENEIRRKNKEKETKDKEREEAKKAQAVMWDS